MNLLLLTADQLDDRGRCTLDDDRARHIRKVLGKGEGDELRVGVVDGPLGRATLLELEEGRVELEVELDEEPPPTLGVDLVLALPRPKYVGRILQATAALGVERLTLVETARVQKSYWQSRVLDPVSIERHLRLGLEQAVATTMPVVETRRDFRRFVEEELAGRLESRPGLVADGSGERAFPRTVAPPATLVVGPEGGLYDEELDALRGAGAQVASLGRRVLKVEVAVSVCLSRCLPE